MTIQEADRIFKEVRAENGDAWRKLRDKARWEGITLLAVIRQWGDPRKWNQEKGGAS